MKAWGYSLAVLVGALLGWLAQQFWLASQVDIRVSKDTQLLKSEQRIKRLSNSDLFSVRSGKVGLVSDYAADSMSPELQLLVAGKYEELLQSYQNDDLQFRLTDLQLETLILGLIELGLYMDALSFLNDLLERASYADEKQYELYMARVVVDIDELLASSAQWGRLTDMYAWLVSVQPSYIPYVLRFVHWLVETNRYDQARLQLASARNDVRYVAEVERLEGEILDRQSFQESGAQLIDLERVGAHFIVELQFGDAGNARMLIDTGASMSVVKTSVLDRLNLSRLEREPVIVKTANGQLSAEKLTAPSVSLGGRILSNVEVVTAPLNDLAYDGLLGMSVLGRLNFYIDQEQNALVISQF